VSELLQQLLDEVRAVRAAIETKSEPSVLLTRKQVGALLQLDERTVRRLELSSEIPAGFEIGGSKRWRRSEIEEWLSTRRPA
jgi:predicted DNA-binding transcriptional regulator AlpA